MAGLDVQELEVIKTWKDLRITSVNFEFDCGGDSMGSTEFIVNTKEGVINAPEIVNYFEDVIYRRVDFYEVSDGHYQGESGTVEITLVEDDDEPYFQYDKQSRSEWNESYSNIGQIELTQEEADFINTYIRSFEGGRDDSDAINYSQDFIMSDRQEEMLQDISQRIHDMASELEMEGVDEDAEENGDDWYRFVYQNIDGDNNMHIDVSKSFTVFKEGE